MSLAGGSATRSSTLAPDGWDDAVWIAQRMVLDAGAQAARLRRQASVQAATICEAAERETEMVWQQASAQAAAIREAAEREAAQLRATVMKLSAGPLVSFGGDVASLDGAGLVAKPGFRTAGRPARRPQGPPRQLVAIRVAAAATSALFLFALAAGTTELALHGFAFFVFRSAGTGETSSHGLQEDQGPGQPDAPKPTPSHIKVRPSPRQHGHRDNG
jgi:hypothetical protein